MKRGKNKKSSKKKIINEPIESEVQKAEKKSGFCNISRLLRDNLYVQLLLVLTVIAIFLRFYHLDFNSLWLDEAFTYNASSASMLDIWELMKSGDFHPPLFHWIEHVMLMFGNTEFILRFVPALLGVATVPLFYLFGREVSDERVGILSAALLTFSPFHIFYSQEAYSYSAVLFVFTLAIIFYVKAIRDNSRKDWIIFGIISALCFWVHFYTIIPVAVLFLHAVLTKIVNFKSDIHELKRIVESGLIFIIFISPLIFIVIERYFTLTARPPTYGVLGPALILESFTRFSSFNTFLAVVFLILFVLGVVPLWRNSKSTFLLFLMLITLPFLISVLLSARMTMNPRYLIYLLTVFYTGIACSYTWIQHLNPRKWIILGLIIAIMCVNLPSLLAYYQNLTKEDWRTYTHTIAENTKNGDFIVLVPPYLNLPFNYYYKNSTDGTIQFGATNSKELETILQMKANNSIYYIVTADITAANPEGDAFKWLQENARFAGSYTNIYTFIS